MHVGETHSALAATAQTVGVPLRTVPGRAVEALTRVAARGCAARERGVDTRLYAFVRLLLAPALRLWFRVRISGSEHIPSHGAAIVAPNHKSFLDAFFVGIATRRHVRFMSKTELLEGPLGWLFLRLGAFPVRRGEADVEAMKTAQSILAQGGLLVIFPEGTRVENPDALGSPHHGAGRLALQTGASIIPAAIAGTHRLLLGPFPKPRRVQLTFLPAIDPSQLSGRPDALNELVDRRLCSPSRASTAASWPARARSLPASRRSGSAPGCWLAGGRERYPVYSASSSRARCADARPQHSCANSWDARGATCARCVAATRDLDRRIQPNMQHDNEGHA